MSLSAELNDASADKVIGSFILNVRQRGTGLAAVLTALASSARAELDQRHQIMAGRASMRRSVQLVVIITIGFAVFLVLFSREYVKPYDTEAGQVALLAVVALFGAGLLDAPTGRWRAGAALPDQARSTERLPMRMVLRTT
jgi:tight adherence protein B